jgi:hypothetical protein
LHRLHASIPRELCDFFDRQLAARGLTRSDWLRITLSNWRRTGVEPKSRDGGHDVVIAVTQEEADTRAFRAFEAAQHGPDYRAALIAALETLDDSND